MEKKLVFKILKMRIFQNSFITVQGHARPTQKQHQPKYAYGPIFSSEHVGQTVRRRFAAHFHQRLLAQLVDLAWSPRLALVFLD